MKKLIFLSVFCLSLSGFGQKENPAPETLQKEKSLTQLSHHLHILASDSMEGRCTATDGQKKAADYIASYMEQMGLQQIAKDSNGNMSWFQSWAFVKRFGDKKKYYPYSENVMGVLPASEPSNEYIVLSAHYDHLGILKDTIYNGADDNGTGSSSLLELIRLLKERNGFRQRNILFIFFSGEEKGLLGSKHFSQNPVLPLNHIMCDINIDMVGRADSAHMADSNYVYVIGSNRISHTLDSILIASNNQDHPLQLDYTYNDPDDPQRLYERSDHYNFAKHGIPVVFFFSGLHPDYHKPTDDIEKINLNVLYWRMMLAYRLTINLMEYPEMLKAD